MPVLRPWATPAPRPHSKPLEAPTPYRLLGEEGPGVIQSRAMAGATIPRVDTFGEGGGMRRDRWTVDHVSGEMPMTAAGLVRGDPWATVGVGEKGRG